MTAGLVSLRDRVNAPTAERHCDIRWLMRRRTHLLAGRDLNCGTKENGDESGRGCQTTAIYRTSVFNLKQSGRGAR